ncbi:unnamed protein product, partial [Adineta steineri]
MEIYRLFSNYINILWLTLNISVVHSSFRLYNTIFKQNINLDYDCIHFHHSWSKPTDFLHEPDYFLHSRSTVLTSYCRRPSMDEKKQLEITSREGVNGISSFTFEELQERNITASQLFFWKAPIDLIERYIIFQSENQTNLSKMIFFNCSTTLPIRFGKKCEYESQVKSFTEYLKNRFEARKTISVTDKITGFTCYTGLPECKRFYKNNLLCLDHREICDGKFDCINGDDEKDCWQLDINECKRDEYRCRNGLCIPKSFAFDFDYDCFDRSDEIYTRYQSRFDTCSDNWWSECDVRRCNIGSLDFSCGDGICSELSYAGRSSPVGRMTISCKSYRDHIHSNSIYNLSTLCAQYVACMLEVKPFKIYGDDINCKVLCPKRNCEHNISIVCPEPYFLFPPGPVLLDIVYFRYHTNRRALHWRIKIPPEDICYDQRACRLPPLVDPSIESLMITDDGIQLTCRPFNSFPYLPTNVFHEYTNLNDIRWEDLLDAIKDNFRDCVSTVITVNMMKQQLINRRIVSCFPNSTKLIPIHRFVDGFPDCAGAMDEKHNIDVCSLNLPHRVVCPLSSHRCITRYMLNNEIVDCSDASDEKFRPQCKTDDIYSRGCERLRDDQLLSINDSVFVPINIWSTKPLDLFNLSGHVFKSVQLKSLSLSEFTVWGCHRGILIDDNNTCLCPPSYYGNRCQYQQAHVSVIIQVMKPTYFDQQYDLFSFVVMLIHSNNNSETIISSEYIYYVSRLDCLKKAVITLPYPRYTTTFDRESIYVRIDAFAIRQMVSDYWSSWIYRPLPFTFLPINRLAIQLFLPEKPSHRFVCNYCSHLNNHQCVLSVNNNPSETICIINNDQCQHTCSIGSACVTTNICVCSQGRLGPQCRVSFDICNSNPCINNGRCIPLDERTITQYQCLCGEHFWGPNCQFNKSKIIITFSQEQQILNHEGFLFHFINIMGDNDIIRYTIFKKLSSDVIHNGLIVYNTEERMMIVDSQNFLYLPDKLQIIIAQSFGRNENERKNFYFVSINYHYSGGFNDYSGDIQSHTRCLHIRELYPINMNYKNTINTNNTFDYQMVCKNNSNLKCVFDDFNLCLCYLSFGLSYPYFNCFSMKKTEMFNCDLKQNICENEGICVQNFPQCPTETFCLCPVCSYGTYCQFSVHNYSLSLDALLGPYIDTSPLITNIYLIISLVMISFGIIFNSLSTLTFIHSNTRQVGCGIYLFYSSLFSTGTLIIFSIKMIYLIKIPSSTIPNYISCLLMEFFLKYLPQCATWLNVCVSIERLINIILGINFNQKRSQLSARWLVWIILSFNILITIHDPLHRHVFIEPEGKRGWCVVKYPSTSWFNKYNPIMDIIHLVCPFFFHIISSLIIIIKTTRVKQIITKENEKYIWLRQLREHKHLIIGPLFLALFALPRLIVSFLYVCNDHYYSGTGST